MKIKFTTTIVLLLFLISLQAQEKNLLGRNDRITLSTSVLQYLHPSTSVFPVAVEVKAYNDVAFYAEYGIALKAFERSGFNTGKLNWQYYKTRLGVRYYFDPLNPYKRQRRWRKVRKRKLKKYRNYIGIEGFVVSDQYTRKNSYFSYQSSAGGGTGPRINYEHSRVYIESKGLVFIYGRRYKLGNRFVLGINYGFGRKIVNVKHEDLVSGMPPTTGFFFGGSFNGDEYREGLRSVGYIKIGIDIGFSVN